MNTPSLNNMTHPEMVAKLVKDPHELCHEFDHRNDAIYVIDILHATLGIVGEVLELKEGLASTLPHAEQLENIIEELGDTEFYITQLRQRLTLPRPDFQAMTLNRGLSPVAIVDMMVINAGHLLDATKRVMIYNQQVDPDKYQALLHKLEYNMACFYSVYHVSRNQALQANLEKLDKRYPGFTFTNEAAHTRADKNVPS